MPSKAHQENRTSPKSSGDGRRKRLDKNVPTPESGGEEDADGQKLVTVQDLRLPDATVVKLMKEALPKNAVMSQEVKDALRRIPTIFALFLTDQALQVTHGAKRRTLLPEDVVTALQSNGFGSYCDKVMPVVEKRRANFRSRKPKPEHSEQPTVTERGVDVTTTDHPVGDGKMLPPLPASHTSLPAGPFSHSITVEDGDEVHVAMDNEESDGEESGSYPDGDASQSSDEAEETTTATEDTSQNGGS